MAHLFNPLYVAVDGNGLAMAGAKLYFYTTGTSTPLDTYSDSSLTAPFVNTNPVVANADGLFGPIYMALDANYKIILKTSADVTVATRDPYSPGSVSFAEGGTNGQIPMINTGNTDNGFDWVSPLNGQLYGLNTSNNTGDATNDIDIAAGGCADATKARWLTFSALTKRLDAAWAVGTNQGGLDTGAVGNSDYYIWGIERSDTGVTDVLFSLSSTAPTMPASYDYKRLIGWFKRSGGAISLFSTLEIANTLTTSQRTDAVKVPLNFATWALVRVLLLDAATGFFANVTSPDEFDAAPSGTVAPLANFSVVAAVQSVADMRIRTSATGTIAARATLATVDAYRVATLGFQWARR
jgi:hypothetical protein